MYIKNLSNFDLLLHKCECGKLNIHGFHQQLESVVVGKRIAFKMQCKCGKVKVRWFDLTTGRRKRMFSWYNLFAPIISWLRWKWPLTRMCYATMWLERKLPI